MYEVILQLNDYGILIHDQKQKLKSGSVKQGINCIDSFSFDILKNNVGFDKLHEFKTLISVYNTKRKKYEFQGRVLQVNPSMDESGLLLKSVICESFLGYLQDTEQDYVYEKNWTPEELLTQLLSVHNRLLADEPEKHFKVGNVFSTENIYIGIQRESTWDSIKTKIIDKIGGEIQLRVEDDGMYIDIVDERGTRKTTPIKIRKNMKAITKESDPSSYITRLIPLGAKIKDESGNDTEERIDITSVNDGKNYIDDEQAIKTYGLHIKYQYWDDVNEPSILKTKATNFIGENNKVLQKHTISYVDLALIGIDIDYIDVCNYYPVQNDLLGIDEVLRVITKTIDIINKTTTNIEIGDKFKTLSDLELEKDKLINNTADTVVKIEKDYQLNIPKIKEDIVELKKTKSVKNTSVLYYLSSSSSELVGGSWVSTPPQWVNGMFYWTKNVTTFSDETTSETTPICITGGTGATGQAGKDGSDGEKGETGTGVESITTQFYLSTSKTELSGGLWVEVMPTWSTGMYLWTRNKIVYKNPTSTVYTEAICDSSWEAVNDLEENVNGRFDDTNDTIIQVQRELLSSIEQSEASIRSEVSESYYNKNNVDQLISEQSTALEQTKNSFQMTFEGFNTDLKNLNDETNSKFEEYKKYIRFKDGKILLGEVGNQLELKISNDRISFLQSGVEVAYFSNSKMVVTDGEYINSLRLGKFAFIPRANGSLDFKKVGD